MVSDSNFVFVSYVWVWELNFSPRERVDADRADEAFCGSARA
jgi:hypothetical protein